MTPPPASPGPWPDGGLCPSCGSSLERVHRHALDRWISVFRTVHRYRCTSPSCGWTGVLGRDAGTAAPAPRRWLPLIVSFAAGILVAAAAVQVLRMSRSTPDPAPDQIALSQGVARQAESTAPGVDFPGAALSPTDPRVRDNPSPLQLRHSCAWGVPGANPYRGTVAQALAAARLPADVVRKIADMAERGWVYDQIEISRDGIRSVNGKRDFGREMRAMAFGDTLCFNTRVNFPAGHVEHAAMYQADDTSGKTYTVMVPYVCQNVSVLGEREVIVYENPEPASWLLGVAGLGLLALARRRRAQTGPRR